MCCPTGNPAVLLRSILLPVDQELDPLTSWTEILQAMHSVGGYIVYHPGWWRGMDSGCQRTLPYRLQLRDVECGMNLHRRGSLSQTETELMTSSTSNRPTKRGANFFDSTRSGRSLAQSHTLWPRA